MAQQRDNNQIRSNESFIKMFTKYGTILEELIMI